MRRPRALRRWAAPLTVLVLGLSLGLGTLSTATGDPAHHGTGSPAYPSQAQVDAAKAAAQRKAGDVGAIKAQLLMANQRLEQAATRAEQASEAYNGAMWRLQQAKDKLRQATADAARARRTVAGQRDRIGALVAQSYQQGGDLSAVNAMVNADGPEAVLDQYAAFQGASTSLQADYQRFAAADSLAQVFEHKARQAKAEQARAAGDAKAAKDQAVSAAEDAQRAATSIAAEKDRLIRELATAQNISVSLARQRQTALEEIARKRAEARARAAAIAAAKAKAAAEAKSQAEAAARRQAAAAAKARQDRRKARSGNSGGNGGGNGGGHADPTPPSPSPDPPEPRPNPTPKPPAPSRGGAQQAISYAKAQLGEPYQWGAAGPGSWDCSGLMMKAWGSAGVSLPHYSVAQYDAGTPISVSDLRPGDLVFWSSNGSPSGIHHVAMYIGGGQIIHAPRTGRPVEIDDMYYWIPPDFFVRV